MELFKGRKYEDLPVLYLVYNYVINAGSLCPTRTLPLLGSLFGLFHLLCSTVGQTSVSRLFTCKGIIPVFAGLKFLLGTGGNSCT